MSENLRTFTRALYGMDAVVRRVPTGAWDRPSPCEGWSARDVVAHQVGVLRGAAATARSGAMARVEAPEDRSDPAGLWHTARDEILEALDRPGVLNRHGPSWFGEMTVDDFIGIVQWDPLTHSWDLAKATGLEPHLDELVVQRTYDVIAPMRPQLAERHLVATSEVPVPEGAGIIDRYLALVGRDPAWS